MSVLDLVCFEPHFRFSSRAMRRFAETRGAIALLAEEGAYLVGLCIAQTEGGLGYVVTLDVDPAWRRCGLARRLMEEVEVRVHAASGQGMALHVFKGNTGAMRFYESIGYGRMGMAEGYYGRGRDAVIYHKNLE